MGVENGVFWSEIGSGFGETGGTPLPKFRVVHPRAPLSGFTKADFFQSKLVCTEDY